MGGHSRLTTVGRALAAGSPVGSVFSFGFAKKRKKKENTEKKAKAVSAPEAFFVQPAAQHEQHSSGQVVYVIDPRRLFCESICHRLQVFVPSLWVRGSDNILEVQEELPLAGLILLSSFTAKLEEQSQRVEMVKVRKRFDPLPVILVTDEENASFSLSALRSGFRGSFPATLGVELLASAVRLVLAGGTFVPPKLLNEWVRTGITSRSKG